MDRERIPRGLFTGFASEYNYIIKIPYINPARKCGAAVNLQLVNSYLVSSH